MENHVYPAVFHPNADDGSYTVLFPDLPGCITEGKDLENTLYMAQSALTLWLEYALEHKEPLPAATPRQALCTAPGEFVNLVWAGVRDGRAVKRTVSLPQWMDQRASELGLSLSRVLQDALRSRIEHTKP